MVSPVVALAIGIVGADGIVRNGMISGRENWSEWGSRRHSFSISKARPAPEMKGLSKLANTASGVRRVCPEAQHNSGKKGLIQTVCMSNIFCVHCTFQHILAKTVFQLPEQFQVTLNWWFGLVLQRFEPMVVLEGQWEATIRYPYLSTHQSTPPIGRTLTIDLSGSMLI